MALHDWKTDHHLGLVPCETEHQSWMCPNMLPVEDDLSFTHEHYECKKCGRKISIDYDDIR